MLDLIAKKAFEQEIDKVFKSKPEILNFLNAHPLKKVAQENLVKELRRAEIFTPLNAKSIDETARSVARFFCKEAIEHKEHSMKSEIQQQLEKDQFRKMMKEQEQVRTGELSD